MQTVEIYSQLKLDPTNYTAGFLAPNDTQVCFHLNTETADYRRDQLQAAPCNQLTQFLSLTVTR